MRDPKDVHKLEDRKPTKENPLLFKEKSVFKNKSVPLPVKQAQKIGKSRVVKGEARRDESQAREKKEAGQKELRAKAVKADQGKSSKK